jgi:hypothetical protein
MMMDVDLVVSVRTKGAERQAEVEEGLGGSGASI